MKTTINAASAEFAECSAVSASSAFDVVTGISEQATEITEKSSV
jgi:hypothetical protein